MPIRFASRGRAVRALLAGIPLLVAACGGGAEDAPRPASDSGAAATAELPPGAPAAAPLDTCPRVGAWQVCSVEKRLRDAGLVVTRRDTPPPAGIAPGEGIVYELGPAELAVWLFPSAAERERASAALDSTTAQPRGSSQRWPRPATLIVSNNLLAVLQSENERTTERVQLALTAGLPPR